MPHHVARQSVADNPAVRQHDQPAAGPDDFLKIMLDEKDRDAARVDSTDHVDLLGSFRVVEAGERLVEQHDRRIEGERAGDLEAL